MRLHVSPGVSTSASDRHHRRAVSIIIESAKPPNTQWNEIPHLRKLSNSESFGKWLQKAHLTPLSASLSGATSWSFPPTHIRLCRTVRQHYCLCRPPPRHEQVKRTPCAMCHGNALVCAPLLSESTQHTRTHTRDCNAKFTLQRDGDIV